MAEADFGDCNTALSPSLSSAQRTKSHNRGRVLTMRYQIHDGFGANEAELLLLLIAANLMAAGAELLHVHGQARLSRERFRAFLLKTAARVLLGGHGVTVVIATARAHLSQHFRDRLEAFNHARGSPHLQALPSHV